ncbi:MAG: hypothetical protein V4506_02435 [Bacteroidota bacterium]
MTSANYETIANDLLKRADYFNRLPDEIGMNAEEINSDLADHYLELSIMLKDSKEIVEFTAKDKTQTEKVLIALHTEMLEELKALSELGYDKPDWVAFHESGLSENYFPR